MPDPRQLHRGSTRVLSAVLVLIGLALIVRTLVEGGGPLATGVILGVLFVLAGGGRLWLQERRR